MECHNRVVAAKCDKTHGIILLQRRRERSAVNRKEVTTWLDCHVCRTAADHLEQRHGRFVVGKQPSFSIVKTEHDKIKAGRLETVIEFCNFVKS